MSYRKLQITARGEKRLRSGHLWVYNNEVDGALLPLKSVEVGEQVALVNAQGKVLGYALINPAQLICGKIVSRKTPFGRNVIKKRIANALALRDENFYEPFYRLVYAEGDFLPGLIIDRFGAVCVVQLNSPGMEAFKDDIASVLQELIEGVAVLFRFDGGSREQEGLETDGFESVGEVPDFVPIIENDTEFSVPVKTGQKTGWFYDHRDNRARVAALAEGKRVLDVFSYIGAWGLAALNAGASELVAVDASEFALDCLEQNAAMNGFENTVSCYQGNAFQALEALLEDPEQKFDIVILDPPAFIKRKKDQNSGLKAYRKINELGLRLLNKGGYLVSASCSMHLDEQVLVDTVQKAARHVDRELSLVYRGGHAADHPVHPAMPETSYLKAQIYKLR